jgi:sulfite reductase (NADPH) flavoprotein alpha-component
MPQPVPFIPDNAPFTAEQRAWLNGYLAGLFSSTGEQAARNGSGPAQLPGPPLLILFGSQSGNAEALAKRLGREAAQKGFQPRVLDLAQHEEIRWEKESQALLISSTWGEGEMPDNAKAFWEYLHQDSAPQLSHLNFSVLALGDTNYADFCQAGKNLDRRLEELGARRLHPRADCDVDYDAKVKEWSEGVWAALSSGTVSLPSSTLSVEPSTNGQTAPSQTGYSRTRPFPAPLLIKRSLTQTGSEKDVQHFEFSIEGSNLSYQVGDALGVCPQNDPAVVDQILQAYGFSGTESVPLPDEQKAPLREALQHSYEIRKFLGTQPKQPCSPVDFVGSLKRLAPRLYSIASSPRAHPGQVHLTISIVRYQADGLLHQGVCSAFLADRLEIGTTTGVFLQPSHGFKLPASGDTPIIMVGPGTGIAPFRAFLEERQIIGASGKNWLFFGDQRRAYDFLYEEQLTAWQQDGFLQRLDLAFSRDQSEKIYVQQRMQEQGAELWRWLEDGAHFYVCGDASRMAKDVDDTLHRIIQEHGGRTAEIAAEYVQKLKAEKRYQRDVY